MARCPKLENKDTGWFSWQWICGVTGEIVGDENNKTKVESLCDPKDYTCKYDNCPIYRRAYN